MTCRLPVQNSLRPDLIGLAPANVHSIDEAGQLVRIKTLTVSRRASMLRNEPFANLANGFLIFRVLRTVVDQRPKQTMLEYAVVSAGRSKATPVLISPPH